MAAAEEVWISDVSGNWSNGLNWLGGAAPPPGGDPTSVLRFSPVTSLSAISTNDYAGSFATGGIAFDSSIRPQFSVVGNPGSSLLLSGPAPEIQMLGSGRLVTMSLPIALASEAGDLRFGGGGLGNLTITSSIVASKDTQRLIIANATASPRTQALTLSGANDIAGGVILQSGNLEIGHSAALGTGKLTVIGGTLRFSGASLNVANAVDLKANLIIPASAGATLSGPISSTLAGTGVHLRGLAGSMLSLSGISTYTGPTTIDHSILDPQVAKAGLLRLIGSGSILNSSEINVRSGGTLETYATSEVAGRIRDDAPVRLRHGTFALRADGSSSLPQIERLGVISAAGYSTISVFASSRNNIRLESAGLTREDRGTFLFAGTLGGNFVPGNGNVLFDTAPGILVGGGSTGANTSILPFAIGNRNDGVTGEIFVTYSPATGIRSLREYEFASFATAAATNNAALSATTTNSVARTVNSLLITSSFGSGPSLTGSGSLAVTSGAILNTASSSTIANRLNFGTAEANIFSVSSLTLSGQITGTGGLTKSGEGRLTLSALNNTFTGPLTINAGRLGFTSVSALGLDNSAIIINGQDAGLSYTGSASATLSRNLEFRTGIGRIESTSGRLTIIGAIRGEGGINVTGGTNGVVALAVANSYTGPTVLTSGRLEIGPDAALGNGGVLNLNGGTLTLIDNWTPQREIHLWNYSILDTGVFSTVWNGTVSGAGGIEKRGIGTFTLNSPSVMNGLTVQGGSVRLAADGALPQAVASVRPGATLVLDNTTDGRSDRLWDAGSVTLANGDFRILGHSASAVSERIKSVVVVEGTIGSTVTLASVGSTGVRLQLTVPLDARLGNLTLRGPKLGAPAAEGSARIVVSAAAAPSAGIVSGIFADPASTGAPQSLVVYDTLTDADGVVGYRGLRPSEYTSSALIQNPHNGGTTPTTAHLLLVNGSAISVEGTSTTVESLTFDGGTLNLAGGQVLNFTSGQILVRGGASTSALTGGKLSLGSQDGAIYTAGDLLIGGDIEGTGVLLKTGPGTLTLSGAALYEGGTTIRTGVLKVGAEDTLAVQKVTMNPGTVLDLSNGIAKVGALIGTGEVKIGTGNLTLGTTGESFSFGGPLTGTGGLTIVDGGNPSAAYHFSGASTLTGTVRLNSGTLSVTSDASLGTGPMIVNGGTLAVAAPLTLSRPIELNADLRITGSAVLSLPSSSAITGSGGIVTVGAAGVQINTALNSTAGVRSIAEGVGDYLQSPGTIGISSPGSVISPAGVQLRTGGKLVLNPPTPADPISQGVLGDSTPVFLNAAGLDFNSIAANTHETFGTLTIAGLSTVSLGTASATGSSLMPMGIARSNRGTMNVQTTGTGMLGGPPGSGVVHFRSTAAPNLIGGGSDVGIVPWAVGMSGTSGTLHPVTYDANGFRLLNSDEYVTSLTAASNSSNVRISGTAVNDAAVSINSLILNSGTITGTGLLAIASGVVMQAQGTSFLAPISNRLEFGAAEAQFFGRSNGMTIDGVISGSGGLTKSHNGGLTLNATNTFTGPITINGGSLAFRSASSLGPDLTSPITLHGNEAALRSLAAGRTVILRPIHLAGGMSTLVAADLNGVLEVANLHGDGGLRVGRLGMVKLSGANTYLGPTIIEGRLGITSDASLGGGGLLRFSESAATLQLFGPWTTSRWLDVLCPSTIDTNGFNATLSGPLTGAATHRLTKAGSGTLTITRRTEFPGDLQVSRGEVSLTTEASLATPSITISRGGTLALENDLHVHGDRILDTAGIVLAGSLRLVGNAITPVHEKVGSLSMWSGNGKISLVRPGAAPLTLSFAGLTEGSFLQVHGDQLGEPVGPSARLLFETAPNLMGGIMPRTLAANNSDGSGVAFATYDSAVSGSGVIGVRPLRSTEYTVGTTITNPTNGGTTPVNANFLVSGPISVTGVDNAINSLTLENSAVIALAEGQTLTVQTTGILVRPGSVSSITGGNLRSGSFSLLLHTEGDLTLSSSLIAQVATKSGAGALVFAPTIPYSGTSRLTKVW
jgi:fibronectin-binding autotransporter adhesin